jgi:hypothetical protein
VHARVAIAAGGASSRDEKPLGRRRALSRWLVALVTSLVLTVAPVPVGSASAADGGQFDAGNIISDAVFYDSTTMSAVQIQAFLNSKAPSCAAGYTCLPNYVETTSSRAATPYCGAYPGGTQTAAQIIAAVSAACGINPKVLIVLLQKEQGLVTATAPSEGKYRIATGFGCPDTAPCEVAYYGFSNQVYLAAAQFRRYRQNPGNYGYRAGQYNVIKWHPNAACGTSEVYIENQATAGLYNYTPYRPNDAALANMYGTGNACSSYGNRNFWAYMTDWFPLVAGTPPVLTANPGLGEPANYLVAATDAGAMSLVPGDGIGGVLPGGSIGTGWNTLDPYFSIGDWNGDGKQDFFARDGAGVLWRYSRDGTGGWLPRVAVGTSFDKMVRLFDAGDFNGDGKPDMWAMDGVGRLWLYPGNGSGGWLPRVLTGTSFDTFSALFGAGDFDGDGNADVMGRDGAGNLWLYPGNGRGGWALPRKAAGTSWNNFDVVISGRDFNGDKKVDVVARDLEGKLWLYPGNGAGGYAGARSQIAGDWAPFRTIFAVGNASGIPTTPSPTPTPTPDPSGTPTPTPTNPPVSPTGRMITGDFTGDGYRDILARLGTGPITIYPGTGAGGTTTTLSADIGGAAYNLLFPVGDFSGDGKEDLMGRDTAGGLWLLPGTGTGFAARVSIGANFQQFSAIFGVGDWNGDGSKDVMTRDSAGQLWLYPGNGSGGWLPRSVIGTSWNQFDALFSPGDVNSDGKPDVMVRDTAGQLWTYPGNGTGGWVFPRISGGTSWNTFNLLFGNGDFDGDGKPDVFARDSAGSLWYYRGSGTGWWNLPRVEFGSGWNGYTWVQ